MRSPRPTGRITSPSRTGVPIRKMTAEMFGKVTGLGRGHGGHMHLFDPTRPLLLPRHRRRGAPPASAQAFASTAARQRPRGRGGHRRGRRQPGRVPRVAQPGGAVEAAGGFRGRGQRLGDLGGRAIRPRCGFNADRAAAYGMPGAAVADNDVDAIYTAAGAAVARARSGEGPTLIEGSRPTAAVRPLRGRPRDVPPQGGWRHSAHDPIPAREGWPAGSSTAAGRRLRTMTARVEKAIAFAKSSGARRRRSSTPSREGGREK